MHPLVRIDPGPGPHAIAQPLAANDRRRGRLGIGTRRLEARPQRLEQLGLAALLAKGTPALQPDLGIEPTGVPAFD